MKAVDLKAIVLDLNFIGKKPQAGIQPILRIELSKNNSF